MHAREEQLAAMDRLLTIMDELRSECPWDRKQTMKSLRHLTIEETYELGEAILNNDLEAVKGELGDLLLHIVFYAKIGAEKMAFDMGDVALGICEKLINRHPHIYGEVSVQNAEEVKKNWERIKLHEGKESVLEGVPKSLPALVKANRIQDKASGLGFDWEHADQVFEKIGEELSELRDEVGKGTPESIESEFGDLLFSLVNYARFLGVNPENALEEANIKFIRRFRYMESKALEEGKIFRDMSPEEMDVFWEASKRR